MASSDQQDRNWEEITALRGVLAIFEKELGQVEAWRALRQLDERERSGQPLQSVDGVLFRGRLLRDLEGNCRVWRAYQHIEEAIEQLLGPEVVPVEHDGGPIARAGSTVAAAPDGTVQARVRIKVRAGRAVVPGDGNGLPAVAGPSADGVTDDKAASRSVLERIRTLKPEPVTKTPETTWPPASGLAAAVWGDRANPPPERDGPASGVAGTSGQEQSPPPTDVPAAPATPAIPAAQAKPPVAPAPPQPSAASEPDPLPSRDAGRPDSIAAKDDVSARILELESRLARLMEADVHAGARPAELSEPQLQSSSRAGSVRPDGRAAAPRLPVARSLIVANDLTPFVDGDDFDEEADVEIVVGPPAPPQTETAVVAASHAPASTRSTPVRDPIGDDGLDGPLALQDVEEASVEIVRAADPAGDASPRAVDRKPSAR